MALSLSVEAPTAPARRPDARPDVRPDLPGEVDQLQARVQWAESKVANLERALATNRRIGIAIGILMYQHRITADQALAILKTCSQHHHVKVRELAETVIYTGTL